MTPRMAGLALLILGMSLRGWALLELRRVGIDSLAKLATETRPDHYAHTGPYRFLNHPAYYGSFGVYAGLGLLAWGQWAGAALLLATTPHYFQRMLAEDQLRKDSEADAVGL